MKWIIMAFAIVLNAAANILIKAAMRSLGSFELSASGFVKAVMNPYFIGGVISFALALAAYAVSLTKFPLSVAYPIMTSVGLLLVAAVSVAAFGESFTLARLFGTLLIIGGVVLVAQSA
jgi:spermidine export protein MdtJ